MIILVFLFGCIVGSFLNMAIYRLGEQQSFARARSYCPHCKTTLPWYDLVPIVSFVLLWARCRFCQRRISFQYPLVECSTGILFAAVAYHTGFVSLHIAAAAAAEQWLLFGKELTLVAACIFFFVFDARYWLVPDQVALPVLGIFFVANFFLSANWLDFVYAGILAGGFFAVQYMVSRGRWIGGGDIRLGVYMGLALGMQNTLVALGIAYGVGAVVGIILLITRRARASSAVPFATFLMGATVIALFFGESLFHWYVYELPEMLFSILAA